MSKENITYISETVCPLLSTQKTLVKCIRFQCAIFNRKVLMCGFAFIPQRETQKETAEDYQHVREV